MDIGVADVYRARLRLRDVAWQTPLEDSGWLSGIAGCAVRLKLECWQRTRSFKVRGAFNAVAALGDRARERGLVAASAGNHGQGVALAGSEAGARVVIFVPSTAPETKKAHIRGYGAELREVDGGYDAAESAARQHAAASGACFVHPYVDPAVVAGQGTIGLEILDRLPDIAEVVVPVGGGGLIAGIGLTMKAIAPRARVIGAQSEWTSAMREALDAGGVLEPPPERPTLADGLAGGVDAESLRRVREVTDAMVVVSERDLARAIGALYREHGIVAEGAGAVGIAAVLAGAVELTGPAVLIVSGGNIDARRLQPLLTDGT